MWGRRSGRSRPTQNSRPTENSGPTQNRPIQKRYRLRGEDIVAGLAPNVACYVSDRITVDGAPVGYMSRDVDGWSFLAGDETQDYVDDPGNTSLVSCNTVANYDRAILPYLAAPVGTGWIRHGSGFLPLSDEPPADPACVPVSGDLRFADGWVITTENITFIRREDDTVQLWSPGLSLWLMAVGSVAPAGVDQRCDALMAQSSPDRYDEKRWRDGGLEYVSYRLHEADSDARCPALHAIVVGRSGHVRVAAYIDAEADMARALDLVAGIRLLA
ncbi:hypothetical protein GCM10027169_37790 [Gordonia jinhuaensis]|uniref:Immunity protein Imm33 domain-containing protein n=1 Tax=Gordonia jinhuaensis TaxID=1517702 RepID=A0A916WSK5_9ACTN|nr:DUF2185 domain-containing protein [Gordonia jinhuaensis]GGB25941.1 hypothetical protein GCM10011489_12640 [Gordonia jinhuaensis]